MSHLAKEAERLATMLEQDNHYWQKRPCETCRNVSAILGRDFGCVAKQKTGGA